METHNALSRNSTSILPPKISKKIDPKELPSCRKFLRKRFLKGSIVTDSGSEETQPDIKTQPARTNNGTENKCEEPSSRNINSDKNPKHQPRFSFIGIIALKKPIKKIIAIARAKKKAFPSNPTSIKSNRYTILIQTT